MDRRSVPVLRTEKGKEGDVLFLYPYRNEKIIRNYRDEKLHLELELSGWKAESVVEIYADFPDSEQKTRWKYYRMENSGGRFFLDINFTKCGLYEIKIRYSHDSGKTWLWDSMPDRKIFVDPSGMRNLRIYTLIPNVSGNITAWKEKLKDIKELNFNAVHLLPVTKMGKSESPYSAADLFDIDPSYIDKSRNVGGLDQFEEFVEESKKLGLKLYLDIVINHVNPESVPAIECGSWIQADESEADGMKRAGCYHHNSWIRWDDLVLLDYDHPDSKVSFEIWNYMYHYVDFWANYADYTGGGLRFDNLHSSDPIFLMFLTGKLKTDYPDLILLGEYFTSKENFYKNVPQWQLNLVLGNPWECRLLPELRKYLKKIHSEGGLKYFLPLSTHDTGSPASVYGSSCSTVPRYMSYALFGTGQTGIVQGSETGILDKINFIGRKRTSCNLGSGNFRKEIKAINSILETESVFQDIGNIRFVDNNHPAVLAAVRSDLKGETAWLLIANFDIYNSVSIELHQKDMGLPFRRFTLENIITGREITVSDMVFDFTVESCGILIFRIRG
jgi:hypothetical protein